MRLGDTIAAPCTPPGSARAMIRVSGPDAAHVVGEHVDLPSGRSACPARWDGLPILVARCEAGASYTGEETIEILLASALLTRVLESLLIDERIRLAGPGEFTARAYLGGRLSLAEAEGVAGLVAAETDAQLEGARDLVSGRTGERCAAWAESLTELLALVEAGIDFTDQEDVIAIDAPTLAARLDELAKQLEQAGGGQVRAESPLVVLVGAPNAGKSTLFNALLGRRRAVVSESAHTTRDVLIETLDLGVPGAGGIRLCDIAGLDDAPTGAAAQEAQRMARRTIDNADVLVWCDPTGRFEGLDRPAIRVRTKADRPGSDDRADLSVCALEGRLGVLERAIADAAWGTTRSPLIVPRHRHAVATALTHVRLARDIDPRDSELIASELRAALDAIGELTGHVHPDDVIGRVFATFCVGK